MAASIANREVATAAFAGLVLAWMSAIAQGQPADLDDPAKWRQLALQRATQTAAEVTDPYRRAEVLTSIARAYVLVDDDRSATRSINEALSVADKIAEPSFKGWVLRDIVQVQIAADDTIGARQTAHGIAAERPQGAALAAIATLQLRGNNLAAARETADRIRDVVPQGEVLRQIAAIHAARGQLDQANAVAREIRDGFYESVAYGDIAVAELRRGNAERAHAAAARAPRFYRPQVYGRIAVTRFDGGDLAGALETLQKIDDDLYRAAVQGRIAKGRSDDRAAGERMFADAVATARAVDNKQVRKGIVLSQLARMQNIDRKPEAAREILQHALAAAATLRPGEERDEVLDAIARAQARAGDASGALSTATLVAERTTRALLIRDVAMIQAETTSDVIATVNAAGLGDPLAETAAYFGLLGAQLTQSGKSLSSQTIDAARDSVRRLQELQLRPAAFSALAGARVTIGDRQGAWALFQESLGAAEKIERPDQRAAAYVRIVNALNERLMFLGKPAEVKEETADPAKP